jgi:hypothetical protein
VKLLLPLLLALFSVSCTTLENRRDLYSPEPGPDSRQRQRELSGDPKVINTTAGPATEEGPLVPRPDFR